MTPPRLAYWPRFRFTCYVWRHVLAGLLAAFAALPAAATIPYRISLAGRDEHLFHVTMTVPGVRGALRVQLPAWNALYQIRDFAHRLRNLRARDAEARPLSLERLDAQTWRVTGSGRVMLDYSVYWDEASPFSSQLNRDHAFLNFATVLLYVPDRRGEDVRIQIADLPRDWRIAVALAPGETSATFTAPSYDALVDAPMEVGQFDEFGLDVSGMRLRVAVDGKGWNRDALSDTLRRVVAYEVALIRGAPARDYLFLYHFGPNAGGMEHANSTAIFLDNPAFAAPITAHEFFHAWNVKRIRPQSLEPVDYSRENWTRALWFAEGVTNTFAAYTMVRTSLWSRQQFYDDLAAQITELESRPAHAWQSAEEASLNAWLEKYPIYRRPDSSISYYNKGQILGVLLDITIRDVSDNRASLDDVLRALNDDFARRERFYDERTDIRATAERIAGRDLGEFFRRYVSGTAPLPYAELLPRAGLVLKERQAGGADLGFVPNRSPGSDVLISEIESGGPAERAGLIEGDVLLELDGATPPRNVGRWLRGRRPGDTVRVRLRRGAEEMTVSYALGQDQQKVFVIEEASRPGEKQRRIHEGLLRGVTEPIDAPSAPARTPAAPEP